MCNWVENNNDGSLMVGGGAGGVGAPGGWVGLSPGCCPWEWPVWQDRPAGGVVWQGQETDKLTQLVNI